MEEQVVKTITNYIKANYELQHSFTENAKTKAIKSKLYELGLQYHSEVELLLHREGAAYGEILQPKGMHKDFVNQDTFTIAPESTYRPRPIQRGTRGQKKFRNNKHNFNYLPSDLLHFDIENWDLLPQFVKTINGKIWFLNVDASVIPNTIKQLLKLGLKFTPTPDVETFISFIEHYPDLMKYKIKWSTKIVQITKKAGAYLKENGLIVKETDKNMGPCIISKEIYCSLTSNLLNDVHTFELLDMKTEDIVNSFFERINLVIPQYIRSCITPTEQEGNIPRFTGLPKVHKNPLKLRPVINASKVTFTKLSMLIDDTLKPIINKLKDMNPFNVKNIDEFISKIREKEINTTEYKMDALDISSLYTNIPIDLVLESVEFFTLQNLKDKTYSRIFCKNAKTWLNITVQNQIDLISIYLEFNYLLTEDNKVYKQIQGIPTGGNCSPSLAMLALSYLEIQFRRENRQIWQHYSLSARYLDDWIIITTDKNYERERFQTLVYKDKFILEPSNNTIANECIFLDGRFRFEENKITFRLYRKPGNAYSYIHAKSFIPLHIKKGFIVGEIIRIYRRCFHEKDALVEEKFFVQKLIQRGYEPKFLRRLVLIGRSKFKQSKNNSDNKPEYKWLIVPYLPQIPYFEYLEAVRPSEEFNYALSYKMFKKLDKILLASQ